MKEYYHGSVDMATEKKSPSERGFLALMFSREVLD
jgi:hypothetical protein